MENFKINDYSTNEQDKRSFEQGKGVEEFQDFKFDSPESLSSEQQEEIEELGAGALRNAVVDGDVDNGSVMAGQIAGLVSKEETCAEILEDIYYGAAKVIQREAARWADVNV